MSPTDLMQLGFTQINAAKSVYKKHNLYLQLRDNGFYIVDSFLEPLHTKPIVSFKEIKQLNDLLLG